MASIQPIGIQVVLQGMHSSDNFCDEYDFYVCHKTVPNSRLFVITIKNQITYVRKCQIFTSAIKPSLIFPGVLS